jgi:hypothetical protein
MNLAPSQDQVMAQLRILIPALATAATAFGVNATEAGSAAQIALASLAPISYVIVVIWSMFANTRKSIMLAASKPVDASTPAPQIILPAQEKALADTLPSNVTAK